MRMLTILQVILFLAVTACGDEKKEEEEKKESNTGTVTSTGTNTNTSKTVCESALASYQNNIKAMVERCKECHTTGMPYANYMNFGGNDNSNRLLLRDKKASTAAALYTFLSGTHTGKTALQAGDDTRLETWFAAENACPEGSDGLQ